MFSMTNHIISKDARLNQDLLIKIFLNKKKIINYF